LSVRELSLADLVARVDGLAAEEVALDRVSELVSRVRLAGSELRPYLNFQDDRYTRNLVHRSDLFDVIVLCWMPGHRTPVHNHSGQLGWVRVLRGALEETAFAPDPDLGAGGPEPVEEACLLAARVALVESGHALAAAGEGVITVDRERAVHRLGNPAPAGGEAAVSLHLYSRPHDSCLVFDLENQRGRRRTLAFDTTPGAPSAPRA